VAAQLARLIDDRDQLDVALAAALDAGFREGLARQLRALYEDVDFTTVGAAQRAHSFNVDARVAQLLAELSERSRLVLQVLLQHAAVAAHEVPLSRLGRGGRTSRTLAQNLQLT